MIPLTEEGKSIKIFRSSHAPNTLRKTSKEAQLANDFSQGRHQTSPVYHWRRSMPACLTPKHPSTDKFFGHAS
jgi:hypothetical protein